MTTPALVTGVHQLTVPCKNLARATAFYRDAVRLPFLFEAPPGLAFFQCGATRLMLTRGPEEKLDPLNSVIYFGTDDIEGATKAVVAHGAKLEAAPHAIAKLPGREVWLSHWMDPEGNMMSFMQEKSLRTA